MVQHIRNMVQRIRDMLQHIRNVLHHIFQLKKNTLVSMVYMQICQRCRG